MKKYTYKCVSVIDWSNGLFDSVKECIKDAKEQGYIVIQIAEATPYKPYIYAEDILEKIEDEVYVDYGIDFEFRQDEEVEKLSKRLTEVLHKWLKETYQVPNCYDIDEDTIEVHEVK